MTDALIAIQKLKLNFSGAKVLDGVDLDVKRGEILAVVGGSGSGKSTLLRCILMLQAISAGSIFLFGKNIARCSQNTADQLRRRWGMLFQQSALFSSLSVLENVAFPLREYTQLDDAMIIEIAKLKLALVGLEPDAAYKWPSELSGGMQKRAALARALALDPELLFLDEPTAGLDPQSAAALDGLVLTLKEALGLTVVMVTHDMDSLVRVPDRVAFLGEGKVLGIGSVHEVAAIDHPLIKAYFSGPRGRIVDDEKN